MHEGQVAKREMRDECEESDEAVGKGEISTLLTSAAHIPGAFANRALGADVTNLVALVAALVGGDGDA